jgi:predicted MPP superfamily phosphohydrolase
MLVAVIILSMLALDPLCWVWGDRILRKLRRSRLWRSLFGAFMGVQLGCLLFIIVGRVGSERTDEFLPRILLSAVFLWHFIMLPIATVIALLELLARLIPKRAAPAPLEANREDASPSLNRRQFLRGVAIAAPPVATVLTTGFAFPQQQDFRIRRIVLPLKQLPVDLDGLTISQVTDIHVGRFTETAMLKRIVEASNSLRADLCLLTGDLINHALADLPAGLDAVKKLDSRFGTYMIEGNHDLFESRKKFEQTVRDAGVPLLINESTMLKIRGQDVQLLGLKWGSTAAGAPNAANQRGDGAIADSMNVLLPQMQSGAFPILLAHHPHAFDPAAAAGIPLTVSGHTHGGQIMVSPQVGFGPMMFRYWSGIYQKGDSRLVVSNGVGNWFPLRINAPAEIVHITLKRA